MSFLKRLESILGFEDRSVPLEEINIQAVAACITYDIIGDLTAPANLDPLLGRMHSNGGIFTIKAETVAANLGYPQPMFRENATHMSAVSACDAALAQLVAAGAVHINEESGDYQVPISNYQLLQNLQIK